MREELAEQLLGDILEWDTDTAKGEIADLRFLAAVKHDGYRNFEPGYRFIESLVLWLRNFSSFEERQTAYDFTKGRMLYFSETQMDHLVGLLYHQRVTPILVEQSRKRLNLPWFQIKKIKDSDAFQCLRRRTLFVGMSDGARMDAFRRKNGLSNEQICISYEFDEAKLKRLHDELKTWIDAKQCNAPALFENIFLIDDFSGSGNSILRSDQGRLKGKLAKFFDESLGRTHKLGPYCVDSGPNLFVVMYVATDKAIKNLREGVMILKSQANSDEFTDCTVLDPLQLIGSTVTIPQPGDAKDAAFDGLLTKYYDSRLEDVHTKTGGPNVIHGYADCSLPLVLCHNCPNDSVYLLWGQTEKEDGRQGLSALFPRISRHSASRD